MSFSTWIIAIALLGVWSLHASKAQVGKIHDIEEIFKNAVVIRENFFDKFQIDGTSTSNCLIHGIKSRNIDILQLQQLADHVQKSDYECNTLEYEWKYDFRDFFQPVKNEKLSKTCGKFSTNVWKAAANGHQILTKNIITGLLSTIQPNVTTPDAVTFLENSAQIVKNSNIEEFALAAASNVYNEIATETIHQNLLKPEENYQLISMANAQSNIEQITNFNIFSIIKPGFFPPDVIEARDVVYNALDSGILEECTDNGWTTPLDQLLSLMTSLTKVNNLHPTAPSIHVLFSHIRMWYLCINGYQFKPNNFNDIVFLLNSFLTIRNPTLLREIYHEFSKIPLQDLTSDLDYSQYCDPRSLMNDIIRKILSKQESLPMCNTILFNYFLNADDDCPHWLKPIFPANSTENKPLEMIPPERFDRPIITTTTEVPTTTEKPFECEENETKMIDTESLLALFDVKKYPTIATIIKENPYPANAVRYNTREGVFKEIIAHLINTRNDFPTLKKGALHYAQYHLELNHLKFLPVKFTCECEIEEEINLNCGQDEIQAVDPESLIEIFKEKDYPLLAEYLRNHPINNIPISSNRHSAIVKTCETENLSIELSAICRVFLGKYPPINEKGNFAVTWTCLCVIEPENVTECKMMLVINQESLIGIMQEEDIEIKNLVYVEPVFLNDYHNLDYREEILRNVLADRIAKIQDSQHYQKISKAINQMTISWRGMLSPVIDEICEHDLKYNIRFEPVQPNPTTETLPNCENVTVINQQKLIEIIKDEKINVLKNLIFMDPVYYSDYKHLRTNEEILRQLLIDRMEQVDDEILNLVVPMALERLQISWRGLLPPIIEQVCKTDLVHNEIKSIAPIDNEDDIICENDEPILICEPGEKSTMVVDTSSLFDVLGPNAPRASAIRQKILSFVYPIVNNRTQSKSFVLRNILLDIRETIDDPRLLYKVDQLLVSIQYDKEVEPILTKQICLEEELECGPEEILSKVVDMKALLEVFKPNTLIPLYIRDILLTYIVPLDSSKSYTNSELLLEILNDISYDASDDQTQIDVIDLMSLVQNSGIAFETPKYEMECLPKDKLAETPCDNETGSGEDQVDEPSDVTTLKPSTTTEDCDEELEAFGTNNYPILPPPEVADQLGPKDEPEESKEIPLFLTTTQTPIETSDECEESEETTTTTTTAVPLEPKFTPTTSTTEVPTEFSEECEELEENTTTTTMASPTTTTTVLTTTTTVAPIESSEECEESEEITTTTTAKTIAPTTTTTTTVAPIEYSEECEDSEETTTTAATTTTTSTTTSAPTTTSTTTTMAPLESEEECDESEETTTTTTTTTTTVAPIESSEECDELEETTTTSTTTTTPTETPVESSEECDEPEEIPTTSTTTTTKEPTTQQPTTAATIGELSATPQPPLTECPCPDGTVFTKILNNQDFINLVPLTDSQLRHQLSQVILPVTNLSNLTKFEILEEVLKFLQIPNTKINEIKLKLKKSANGLPQTTTLCAPKDYTEIHPADVIGCNDPDPWWYSQCACKSNENLVHAFLSYDIYNLLPYAEQSLRDQIARMTFPVSQYAGQSRRQILKQVLQHLKVTTYYLNPEKGGDFPRVTAVCVPKDLFPMDQLKCPTNQKSPQCIYPIEFINTKSLLNVIIDQNALVVARELVELINNSLFDKKNYGSTDTRAKILAKILIEINSEIENQLKLGRENEQAKLQQLLHQIKPEFEQLYVQEIPQTTHRTNSISTLTSKLTLNFDYLRFFVIKENSFNTDRPCLTNQWPLLLKINPLEKCFDEKSMVQTYPVDIVDVADLLHDAKGSSDEKYIVSAKLAGLDTHQHVQSFDWDAFCSKQEFFNALMQHINFKTELIQDSQEPVIIKTVCRKQLVDVLPQVQRSKRHIHLLDSILLNNMQQAMEIARELFK